MLKGLSAHSGPGKGSPVMGISLFVLETRQYLNCNRISTALVVSTC